MIDCKDCGKPIEDDEYCYQIRYGYMDDESFSAEEDIEYYHEECY